MTGRAVPLLVLLAWTGATLLLAGTRLVRRPTLVARLGPYQPSTHAPDDPTVGRLPEAVGAWQVLGAPLVAGFADRLDAVLGTRSQLEVRLRRAGRPVEPVAFRARQAGTGLAGVLVGAMAAAAVGVPAVPALIVAIASGTTTMLVAEQRLSAEVAERQEHLRLELPVVAEQLGMLLSAGWSLGSAMNRLAERGRGRAAEDLAVVCGRIRHGLSEGEALAEWAARADLVALDRLVAVLSLDRHTSDVGRLIAEEARSMRRDSHRILLETIERRSQAVWIPVTVAALVPGVVFLAVPFVDALRTFTAT